MRATAAAMLLIAACGDPQVDRPSDLPDTGEAPDLCAPQVLSGEPCDRPYLCCPSSSSLDPAADDCVCWNERWLCDDAKPGANTAGSCSCTPSEDPRVDALFYRCAE